MSDVDTKRGNAAGDVVVCEHEDGTGVSCLRKGVPPRLRCGPCRVRALSIESRPGCSTC